MPAAFMTMRRGMETIRGLCRSGSREGGKWVWVWENGVRVEKEEVKNEMEGKE
jgi:hypothetical protein